MINARGTCREFVTVTRANVTLRGDPAAEIVVPRQDRDLPAVSADGVTLEKLTLAGRMTGLSQDHAPAFTARNCVIPDTSDIGVSVLHGSVISGNGQSGAVCMGNHLVPIGRATIAHNGNNGITLPWGAKLILEEPATSVSGNTNLSLWCGDSESSFMAMAPLDTTGPILCTDSNN